MEANLYTPSTASLPPMMSSVLRFSKNLEKQDTQEAAEISGIDLQSDVRLIRIQNELDNKDRVVCLSFAEESVDSDDDNGLFLFAEVEYNKNGVDVSKRLELLQCKDISNTVVSAPAKAQVLASIGLRPLEICINLDSFVELYEMLTPPENGIILLVFVSSCSCSY